MLGVILEDVLSASVVLEYFIELLLNVLNASVGEVLSEDLLESRIRTVHGDYSGTEVYLSFECGVYSAEVDNKLAVNVKPEVVVTLEFKDDVMTLVFEPVTR